MIEVRWRLAALISTLDDETLFARPLLLPGVSCYATSGQWLKVGFSRRVANAMRQMAPGELYRYLPPEMPSVRTLTLHVPALHDDICRQNPVDLKIQYVVWRHGTDAVIALIPALGIEVVAENERQLGELIEPQMKMALSRNRWNHSLRDLAATARFRALKVRPLRLKIKLPTLKEAAQQHEQQKDKSLLKEIATNLVTQPARPVYERESEVRRLAELLTRREPRSVLLVGRSGVGKTALVQHLAKHADDLRLGQIPIWSTSGSRIVAGMSGFGMWQERCEKLVVEARKTKAVLHLGNLVELIETGKGGGNVQGVAALMRPHLDRAEFLAIVECTPEQWALVEREDPQLLETFVQLDVAPPSPEQTREILAAVASEYQDSCVPAESMATLDRLHRRWTTYSAAPGRQIRFLRNLLEDRIHRRASPHGYGLESSQAITPEDVTGAFSHETGLPRFMLDDSVPLDLDETRSWFAQRVIGQTEAVGEVVDLLAAVATEMTRGGKPIASLLFIGPTGVGKTEMAKSLAEFLYQDRGRLVRFDMSEFSHPAAIERLIGGAYSAQGLLTQKVRDQPFTVVLLDEFEKAHPQFFDLLLQVLGEGRLTDGWGRVTDFTNSVVIMTSNLGADSYRRGVVGFRENTDSVEFAARHFEREVKSFLRPEMFNRLDRIVPFRPLDRSTIAAIARRELDQVLTRDGLHYRGVDVTVDDAVVEYLAEIGFDPRYGARPLKRVIERQLVAPLAAELNRYTDDPKLTSRVYLVDRHVDVDVLGHSGGREMDLAQSVHDAIQLVIDLRRRVQALQQSGIVVRFRNEIERIRQEQRTRERRLRRRGQPVRYDFTPEQARLLGREELLHRIETLAHDVTSLEDRSLTHFYASQAVVPALIEKRRVELDQNFQQILFDLSRSENHHDRLLTIAAFGEPRGTIIELLSMYRDICRQYDEPVRWFWLKLYRQEHDESLKGESRPAHSLPSPRPIARLLARREHENDERPKVIDVYDAHHHPFENVPSDCIGVAMQLKGERTVALLQTELGRHEFLRTNGARENCLVDSIVGRLLNYDPPRDIGRRGSLSNLPLRRTYDLRQGQIRDERLEQTISIRGRQVGEALNRAVEEYLAVRLKGLIEAWS